MMTTMVLMMVKNEMVLQAMTENVGHKSMVWGYQNCRRAVAAVRARDSCGSPPTAQPATFPAWSVGRNEGFRSRAVAADGTASELPPA